MSTISPLSRDEGLLDAAERQAIARERLQMKLAECIEALHAALRILDDPQWKNKEGVRPNADPMVDVIRSILDDEGV